MCTQPATPPSTYIRLSLLHMNTVDMSVLTLLAACIVIKSQSLCAFTSRSSIVSSMTAQKNEVQCKCLKFGFSKMFSGLIFTKGIKLKLSQKSAHVYSCLY